MARRRIALLPGAALALSLLLASLLSGSVAAGGGCHAGQERDAAATEIVLTGNCINPLVARVPVGAVVTFTNGDKATHAITGAGNTWGTYDDLIGGTSVAYRFTASGVFPYFCHIHPGMVGAVVVGDASPGGGGGTVKAVSQSEALNAASATTTPAPSPAPTASAAAIAPVAAASNAGSSSSPTAPAGLLIVGLLGVLLAAGAAYAFGLVPRRRTSPR